jgi:ankyrin repeat protein
VEGRSCRRCAAIATANLLPMTRRRTLEIGASAALVLVVLAVAGGVGAVWRQRQLATERLRHVMQFVPNPDPVEVRALLERGADPNARLDYGHTVLIAAAIRSDLALVRELLRRGADLHATDDEGGNVLHHVVTSSDLEMVKLFLDLGVDVNSLKTGGETALMLAVWGSDEKPEDIRTVRLLIAHGADVNARDSDGRTALTLARELENPVMARLLRQAGAR